MVGVPAARDIVPAFFLGLTAIGCRSAETQSPLRSDDAITIHHFAMGCVFRVVLYGESAETARALEGEVAASLDQAEKALSVWDPESEVSRLNARAAREAVRVGDLLWQTVERSVALSRATRGAFDVTVGPLIVAYDLRTSRPSRPDPERLARARESVGFQHIVMDREKQTIAFDREG